MADTTSFRRRRFVMVHAFDSDYLDRLRCHDPETEQHFVSYFSELILIKLRARGLSQQLVEDIRQETFLRVLGAVRSPTGIRQPERLGAFVNSVCNNVMLESLRSQGRHPIASEKSTTNLTDETSFRADDRLITQERKAEVRRIVDGLPPRDRQVLRAVFLEERDRDEVCAQLGVGRDYLRVLLHRAKTEFRNGFLKRRAPQASPAYGAPLQTI